MARFARFTQLAIFAIGYTSTLHALAADPLADRHAPYLLSPSQKPAGVPAEYVLTHNGFFHPSCVITVRSDEVTGADGVIRGLDGAEHARFGACAYPHYGQDGREGAPVHAPPEHAAPVLYDGYIVYYSYWGKLPVAPTLTTNWTVPLAPKQVAGQDIAFFNDILTSAGGGDILQPVLDFNGESANHWAIESEHCCISGNDMQTTPVNVNVGDRIRGTVVGTNCTADGVCQNWAVTTADLTTNKSTTLNTTAPMGVPNGASPASLETYGVTACDLFPASGTTTFADNALTSASGTATLKYDLGILDSANAEVPRNCGYAGKVAGNDYTLIYGEVAAGGSGGAGGSTSSGGSANGGAGGRATGGAAGSGVTGNGGASGDAGASGAVSSSGAGGVNGSAGSSGNTGTSGVAGTSNTSTGGSAGAIGAAGANTVGGASGHAGVSASGTGASAGGNESSSSAGTAANGSTSDDSGCSCALARTHEREPWNGRALLGLLASAWFMHRARRHRASV